MNRIQMKIIPKLVVCTLLLLLPISSRGQGFIEGWAKEDQRLLLPVSLHHSNILIGELLDELAKQTKVPLIIDNSRKESGISLYVSLDRVPLGDVMDSLHSLLSLPNNQWQWGKSGKRDFVYRIYPSKIEDIVNSVEAVGADAFVNYTENLRSYLSLSPKERIKQKRTFSKALHLDDDIVVNDYLTDNNRVILDTMQISLKYLNRDAILRVLKGESIQIPLKEMDSTDLKVVMGFFDRYQVNFVSNGDRSTEVETPKYLNLRPAKKQQLRKSLTPFIMVGVGKSASMSCFGGGLNYGLAHEMYKRWLLGGDHKTSAQENAVLPLSPSKKSATPDANNSLAGIRTESQGNQYQDYLDRIGANLKAPILALLSPQERMANASSSVKGNLRNFLSNTEGYSLLKMHKWRREILLITNPTWMYDQDGITAVKDVQKIQLFLSRSDKRGILEGMSNLLDKYSAEQLNSLSERFPQLLILSEAPDLLRFSAQNPEIFRPTGLVLDNDVNKALLSLVPGLNSETLSKSRKLRWTTGKIVNKEITSLSFTLEISDPSGKWSTISSLP